MPGKPYPISEIKQVIDADGAITQEYFISTLITDSRRISNATRALFFALSNRRDGHEFIKVAYDSGIRNFVVSNSKMPDLPGSNFLLVDDVLAALQKLAAWHRANYNLEVIGVTGSNGKTIVKEWLYQLMSPDKNIVRNSKSYNSQIGVPLSIWQINEYNNLGMFEAGVSTVGEMHRLEQIIKPGIGILTHIGPAHDEGFENRAQKLKEKLGLFRNCKLVVGNYELLAENQRAPFGQKLFTWSEVDGKADLLVFEKITTSGNTSIQGLFTGMNIDCSFRFSDGASIENIITCWATMLAMGYQPGIIKQRISRLGPVSMRLELKSGINKCSIIDDSYNSDLQSLEIALNFLGQQNQHPKKTLILSDIFQSGLPEAELYRQIADLVTAQKIDKFIGIGETIVKYQDYFTTPKQHFYGHTSHLLQQLSKLRFSDETILIKGSRVFELERISQALVQKAHETVLEINLNGLINNLNYYRSKLNPGVKVMAMVKAFSYGSGTFEVANVLQYNNVDYLAVAYIDEGVALREAGITLSIMVLNPEPSGFNKLIDFELEPVIYSFNLLDEFLRFANGKLLISYPVHLKIETGMHRLGFRNIDLIELCHQIKANMFISVQSVFSHLAASEAPQHDDFTKQQISLFEQAAELIQIELGYKVIRHLSNTSGISRWPQAQYEMVRLGIGLYGVDAAVSSSENGLVPIASLKTSIAQVMHVRAGETISYGRSGSLLKDGTIATVRIGYADGYLRAFGNGVGRMLVNGQLAPTVGNITMDMCMLDISDIKVSEGNEVIVFNAEYRIETLALQIGTIPYEILTNVSQRVKRVYFYE